MRQAGFTLIELLVVVAIIAVMASLLMPAVTTAQALAKASACSSNLRQIGMAYVGYASDYDDTIAYTRLGAGFWINAISPYADANTTQDPTTANNVRRTNSVLWGCPVWDRANNSDWNCGYGANPYQDFPSRPTLTNSIDYTPLNGQGAYTWVGFIFGGISYSSTRLLVFDYDGYQYGQVGWVSAGSYPSFRRHRGGANALFVDCHVARQSAEATVASILNPTK